MKVWKFPIETLNAQSIAMPTDAVILTAQFQGSVLCLWAQVDPKMKRVKRRIVIVDTGEEFETSLPYIATVQDPDSIYVYHVFDGGADDAKRSKTAR